MFRLVVLDDTFVTKCSDDFISLGSFSELSSSDSASSFSTKTCTKIPPRCHLYEASFLSVNDAEQKNLVLVSYKPSLG